MIHWTWLLPVFLIGGFFGYATAGMFFTALEQHPPVDDE